MNNSDVCPGCQRLEFHKMCPAHGTPFYMSGVPYTENDERNYNEMDCEVNQLFYFEVMKARHEYEQTMTDEDKVRERILDELAEESQKMGLYDPPFNNPLIK